MNPIDCSHSRNDTHFCLRLKETQHTCRDCGHVETHTARTIPSTNGDLWRLVAGEAA